MLLCGLIHEVHKTEAVGKDDIAARLDELVDGVGTGAILGYVGLDDHLIIPQAKLLLHVQAALFVGIVIAVVAGIADVDQADLHVFLGQFAVSPAAGCQRLRQASNQGQGQHDTECCHQPLFHCVLSSKTNQKIPRCHFAPR